MQRLAQQWDIAPAAVVRDLGLLRDEGLIVTRPGKPAVVTESLPEGMDWFVPSGHSDPLDKAIKRDAA